MRIKPLPVREIGANPHYEGRYLFQDTLLINMVPPAEPNQDWLVEYAWQSKHSGPPTDRVLLSKLKKEKLELLIPIETTQRPGITGKVRLIASEWNANA